MITNSLRSLGIRKIFYQLGIVWPMKQIILSIFLSVVFDYLILPPVEDDPGGSAKPAKPRTKKIFQLLPVNSENAKNMIGLDATPMKQSPQGSYVEVARHPHHNQAPSPPARHRNPDAARRLVHSPPPPHRQSQREQEPARNPQRDPAEGRHSHYSPEQPSRLENPPQAQYEPERTRGRHRHHDPNSPRHAHHKIKTTGNPYETETPKIQYQNVEKIRIVDPNPDNIENDNSFVPEKTGIPYLDSDTMTGNPYVNPVNNVSPYNPEIKISNYGNGEGTMNYGNPGVSALPYVHPVITATNYASDEITIKPYVNPYREPEINQNSYNIHPRTEDPYYIPVSTERSANRKYKYYGKSQVGSYISENNTYGSSTAVVNRHYHQEPQVEKRDDYFASYERDYPTVATKQPFATAVTSSLRVLECYSCYSSAKTSRACIEPTKYG